MAKSTMRAGLLGAGYIARWHAMALKRIDNAQFTAVCDVSPAASQDLADDFGIKNVFGTLEAMLEADVCDVVHVLTPPHLHFEATRTILQSGCHAIVEKPMTLSAKECQILARLAEKNNLRLAVNHNFLTLPSYEKLKRHTTDGTLGPIDTLTINWQFSLPPLRTGPYNPWMLRRAENLLYELGPHLFAFVHDLAGNLENISVRLRNPIEIPGGITHYQGWQISGEAGATAVTLNISLIEGHDNRSIHARGVGGLATVNFAEDSFLLERANSHEIVLNPLMARLSVSGQTIKGGIVNAWRQFSSLNAMAPYGLSMKRALELYYNQFDEAVDQRLSAASAYNVMRMIDQTVEIARKQIKPPQIIRDRNKRTPSSNILVIGGTGFIGRHLVNTLADRGHAIKVFSRGSAPGFERPDNRISVHTGSLKNHDDLQDALQGIDVVYHLARANEKTWAGYLENDLNVTRLIGECCLKAGVKRLIYTGTIDSYDATDPNGNITEDTAFDSDLSRRNLYAQSKAACETELLRQQAQDGLQLVIARPGIVIGNGGPLQHWGIGMWRGATTCKLWGHGSNKMPFVLVEDVVAGLIQIMTTKDIDGQSFNFIGDPILSAREYFAAIHEVTGVKIRIFPTSIAAYYIVELLKYAAKKILARDKNAKRPRYHDWKSRTQASTYINTKAKQVLGWQPEKDRKDFIQQGIRAIWLFGIDV